jgi:hypothetical protein
MIKCEGDKMGRARIWVSLIKERKRCEGKTFEELTNTKKKTLQMGCLGACP